MRRRLIKHVFIGLAGFFIISGWLLFAYSKTGEISSVYGNQDLIRFHVLANSDSLVDQQVKLRVRDAVVAYLTPYLKDVKDPSEARRIVAEKHDDILKVADGVLTTCGANYSARVEMGTFQFPVKTYGNITLPAGQYEAVRILLGKAEGKNWWCILFPPLCFIDVTNAAAMPNGTAGPIEQNQGSGIEFRWKIAEILSQPESK